MRGRAGAETPEQEVADILPLEVDPVVARRVLGEVPFWFHTFALNLRGYNNRAWRSTTGIGCHSCRRALPALRVLDVGNFDGFYAFVAEARGAKRVLAVDSEQHPSGCERAGAPSRGRRGLPDDLGAARFGRPVPPSRGVRLDEPGETFDFVFCLGILHRVTDPLGLLRLLRARLADAGRVLLETYGVTPRRWHPLTRGTSTGRRLHRRRVHLAGAEEGYAASPSRPASPGLSSTLPRSSTATHGHRIAHTRRPPPLLNQPSRVTPHHTHRQTS